MEIILCDVVMPKLFCVFVSKFVVFCFYSFQEIETIRPHSDEVVVRL